MDRYDEARNVSDTDDSSGQSEGILGLGGSAVPKMPGDPSASSDPESVRRRRERAMEEEDTLSRDSGGQHSGATGIDMGSGGQGTDISGS